MKKSVMKHGTKNRKRRIKKRSVFYRVGALVHGCIRRLRSAYSEAYSELAESEMAERVVPHLPRKVKSYLKNKYAVLSGLLLALIAIVAIAGITAPKVAQSVTGVVGERKGELTINVSDEIKKGNLSEASNAVVGVLTPNGEYVESPVVLAYNENTNDGYMNNCIFLGDSRTVAMVSYGFISDDSALAKVGIAHTQVEGTTFTQNSGRQYTLSSYLSSHTQPVIYVCYGVNGMNWIEEDEYERTYSNLVDKIIELVGDKRYVVLMSIWPVDDNGRYKGSVKNEWCDKYNEFLYNLAIEKGIYYLDIASILKNDKGGMKSEYDSGDGLHYKASAYNDILDYIIHHPVPGISDEGEYVVKYVKPSGDYKNIMTETPSLPDNTQVVEPGFYVFPTQEPTQVPTPTAVKSEEVTNIPTENPTENPTQVPTNKPTEKPTEIPTDRPTERPTEIPTDRPTEAPTEKPTEIPTEIPTERPTEIPTEAPTEKPTEIPVDPTPEPTEIPTE